MVGKQLERLVSNGKKGSANKSFILLCRWKKGKEVSCALNLVAFIY